MPEIPASHRDLLDGEFATLATIGPDGHPQLSEVWFLAEGETVVTSLNTSRQKIKNLHSGNSCHRGGTEVTIDFFHWRRLLARPRTCPL